MGGGEHKARVQNSTTAEAPLAPREADLQPHLPRYNLWEGVEFSSDVFRVHLPVSGQTLQYNTFMSAYCPPMMRVDLGAWAAKVTNTNS